MFDRVLDKPPKDKRIKVFILGGFKIELTLATFITILKYIFL